MRRTAFARILVATLMPAWLFAQQIGISPMPPPMPPEIPPGLPLPPPQTGPSTGLILGQVVDASDNTPIPGAVVSISGSNGVIVTRTVTTDTGSFTTFGGGGSVVADSEGRFVFGNLAAGSFTITAAASRFQPASYGQTRPGSLPNRVVLQANEKLDQIKISLWRNGAITGTVMDDGGDPVIGATVRATRRTPTGSTTQTTRTDDRGVYRLAGLPPGDYVVMLPSSITTMPASAVEAMQALPAAGAGAAQARQALVQQFNESGAPIPTANGVRVGEAYIQLPLSNVTPTYEMMNGVIFVQPALYFSGASAASSATAVTVSPGDEHAGVDFQIKMVRGSRVSGSVVGPDGPVANFGVKLFPSDGGGAVSNADLEAAATTVTTADGQFSFAAVAPGQYELRVIRGLGFRPLFFSVSSAAGPPTVIPRPPTETPLFAYMPVTVGDRDVTGLAVTLREGLRVSGHIEFDGNAPRPTFSAGPSPVGISLSAVGGSGQTFGPPPPADIDVNGHFTVPALLPGKYVLYASAPGWTLKSAVTNGRDISQGSLDLSSEDVSDVVLTFFDRPAQLSGIVRNRKGDAESSASVYFFASNYQTSAMGTVTPRVRAGADGRYSITGLVPGNYLVVALADTALGNSSSSAIPADTLAPLAQRVSIGEGAQQTQDLTSVTGPLP